MIIKSPSDKRGRAEEMLSEKTCAAKRLAPASASPPSEPTVREIMTPLRRCGLLDDLDEAVFEHATSGALATRPSSPEK
jgi:hypothetical protein